VLVWGVWVGFRFREAWFRVLGYVAENKGKHLVFSVSIPYFFRFCRGA
jgi:hypothetical protein